MSLPNWLGAALLAAPLALAAQTPPTAPSTAPAASDAAQPKPAARSSGRAVDRIVAVVNDEVITESELRGRVQQAALQLRRQNIALPPMEQLRRQILDRLISERAQLQQARETGVRVDDATVNAALGRIAEANNMSLPQLQSRVEADGIPFARFREDIRDEITTTRLREREVDGRIQIPESELDAFMAEQAGVSGDADEYRVAQVLVRVPEGATPAQVDEVRKQAEDIAAKARAGEDFAKLAASFSVGPEALQGGDLGWRNAERLPALFFDAIKALRNGEVAAPVRSPNGFHVLKLSGKRDAVQAKLAGGPVQQTRARHILLRVSDLTPEPEVRRRLEEFKGRIDSKQADFSSLARLHSLDPSGTRGGDLGWLYPGDTVPDFERAMNALKPNEVSAPVQSPFGWHLIQVLERRTEEASPERARLMARQALRERKADEATADWLRQLRDRAYVEIRPEEN